MIKPSPQGRRFRIPVSLYPSDEAEGWPIAAQFNELGYHTAVLTYQVEGTERLLEKDMEDFARALRLIRDRREIFHADADRYITCGFSAGGYLVCLWNTGMGYPAHGFSGCG